MGGEDNNTGLSVYSEVKDFLKQHPGFALTIFYVFLNFLSFFFNYFYYRKYGIDFYHFVEVNDLLFGFVRVSPLFYFILISIGLLTWLTLYTRHFNIASNGWRAHNGFVKRVSVSIFIWLVSLFFTFPILDDSEYPRTVIVTEARTKDSLKLYFLGSSDKYHFFISKERNFKDSTFTSNPIVFNTASIKSIKFIGENLEIDPSD